MTDNEYRELARLYREFPPETYQDLRRVASKMADAIEALLAELPPREPTRAMRSEAFNRYGEIYSVADLLEAFYAILDVAALTPEGERPRGDAAPTLCEGPYLRSLRDAIETAISDSVEQLRKREHITDTRTLRLMVDAARDSIETIALYAAPAEPVAQQPPPVGDRHLLAAWTPERYAGDYPPYINLTMLRNKSDVILTVRLPTVYGAPPGTTTSVTFTRDMWREFVKMIPAADKVFEATDYLDSLL